MTDLLNTAVSKYEIITLQEIHKQKQALNIDSTTLHYSQFNMCLLINKVLKLWNLQCGNITCNIQEINQTKIAYTY